MYFVSVNSILLSLGTFFGLHTVKDWTANKINQDMKHSILQN